MNEPSSQNAEIEGSIVKVQLIWQWSREVKVKEAPCTCIGKRSELQIINRLKRTSSWKWHHTLCVNACQNDDATDKCTFVYMVTSSSRLCILCLSPLYTIRVNINVVQKKSLQGLRYAAVLLCFSPPLFYYYVIQLSLA